MSYKWRTPQEWLEHYNPSYLDLLDLVQRFIDSDEIEDYFQREMEKDGYFEEWTTCEICSEEFRESDISFCERCSRPICYQHMGWGNLCEDCEAEDEEELEGHDDE